MGSAARNAMKGYVYQNYIFTLFLAKMDVERSINKIESESEDTEQFDDLYVEEDGVSYRVQIKNYRDTKVEDIKITEHIFTIKGNKNKYNREDHNVVFINTSQIETNTKFMGFNAIVIDGITIVPILESAVKERLANMFSTENRELQIIHFGYDLTSKSKFVVTLDDLPDLVRVSTNLEHKTIIVREPLDGIEQGITCIIGKPGVGKSHYVNELVSKYEDALVYRFWIGSQDENLRRRLSFDNFLDDLALAIFKSPKNYILEELVANINENQMMIIIDGLDHIENYNPIELSKYIDFIERINRGKIIVLSRPLKIEISWKKIELTNWSYSETALYLENSYNIFDYDIIHKIYSISDGYPIITYFLAEHYNLHCEINLDCQLESLEAYYNLLLEPVGVKTALTIFATNNSFFLESEIGYLLDSEEMAEVVKEFILNYPYLFKKVINRISLIHDSFNTYLRKQLGFYQHRKCIVTKKVKESIMLGDIRYMSRMTSFDFEEDFYDDILLKYCEFSELDKLINTTLDYNSITSFYNQLQMLLEKRENILDVYKYYSFVLINLIVNRNDFNGYEGLVYQILLYMNNHSCIYENIFSSGIMWKLCVLLNKDEISEYKREVHIGRYDLNLYNAIKEENEFFDSKSVKMNFEDILPILQSFESMSNEKRNILIKYLISVWINEDKNEWYSILDLYLSGNEQVAVKRLYVMIEPYDIEDMWIEGVLNAVRYRLYELGFLGENNIFNNDSLKNYIKKYSPKGSFETMEYVKSFIRNANINKHDIDIYSINYAWSMYCMHKDYSVYTIEKALRIFEKYELISEDDSLETIKRLMRQSEAGIGHIMTEYINNKPLEFTKRLIECNYFDNEYPADIFDLSVERINLFDKQQIMSRVSEMLECYRMSKTIEYRDIDNVLHSKYCNIVLEFLRYWGFTVFGGMIDSHVSNVFAEYDINYRGNQEKDVVEPYVPFEYGCIHINDCDYIIENNMSYLEISRYADGWYNCMPYVDLYLLYNQEEIQKDYLKIVHTAIFARVSELQRVGNWHLLIGNIPAFLAQSDVKIKWKRLFDIFKEFLDFSMIYIGEHK